MGTGTSEMGMDEDEDEDEGNDVKRLGRIWVKERGTGDIMPWEGDLMDALFDKLEQQVCFLSFLFDGEGEESDLIHRRKW